MAWLELGKQKKGKFEKASSVQSKAMGFRNAMQSTPDSNDSTEAVLNGALAADKGGGN